ncbi:branched-chain amino acid ABC transporter permease [Nitratireductor aquimarinus]|uniref:Branched-chain amino acid ABC transporter permease n=1 Tax=Nitratireductor aquimarinus TaxID=889300 RepID=A0ABU4APB7_9HYPH|nr:MULTISPECIES: branched-chain amino acid ABC transporter permease [Alphaproteobacteria]MBY6020135.1 branched-chain amino acid ABC transporter permease [Nitratireductor sp. DP7N14-4]MBN7755353.1 branched-chain amino acid ABC transporter permease [Nitratireductor aquimarinus]MBN7763161.1 branched-chain amino acid ABC transporter permease [Nitratireductor aquibiodomus]MBY5998108.1 branched-chain amino acid ABC transporter permease [Tritonibacter mobilis]MCV0352098.1 branched-chain amino acid AB
MTQSSSKTLLGIGLLAVFLALPVIADMLGQPALTSLATRVLIYGIAAASLNFILGFGGMVSFGHAAFFGVGGYVVGILYQHYASGEPLFGFLPGTNQLLITLPLAILVSGAVAAIIGALSLRTSGIQFIMITLAFAQMLFFFFVSLKAYGGDDGLIIRRANEVPGLNMRDKQTVYYVCLAIAVLFFALLTRLVNSRFGYVLAGLRQSEQRMAAIGLHAYRYKLVAFVISGMGAGLAGALMANFMRFASPDMLHWTKSGELMVMVILGGVGTVFGPLIGAGTFIVLETLLASWTENWQLGLGFILLFVVLYTQGGVQALLQRVFGSRS